MILSVPKLLIVPPLSATPSSKRIWLTSIWIVPSSVITVSVTVVPFSVSVNPSSTMIWPPTIAALLIALLPVT